MLSVSVIPGETESAKANGDTRTIHLHHAHTHEAIDATYLVDGRYDSSVLEKLNWFLRDWRRDEPTHMDPRLFDTIWEVYREAGSSQPIEVMSAYRSPETNAMLRRRSRAVAEHSQHILGKAMDQHYVDVPMSRIREIAMRLQRGGVGFYPTAGTPFVHMDVGGVRHWPRMSYDQLARLFPDGKTVHIPSNGQPLPGYEMARAELESRGDSFAYPTATEVKSKGFFAWLFGGSDEEEDAAGEGRAGSKRAQTKVASIDRNSPVGGSPPATFGMSGKDAGARSFILADAASRAQETAPPLRSGPVEQPAPAVPALRPVAPAPSPADQARAQEALAAAMVQPKPVVAPAPPPPTVVAALQPVELPAQLGFTVPMPPRRPMELASDGPIAPLPPGRPTDMGKFVALNSDKAPGVTGSVKRDGIAGLIASAGPGRASGLPAVITQGARPEAPPQVLAYAAPSGVAPVSPLARMGVPVPVARPNFIAARLDRSNFRALTASGAATRNPARAGLGSAVTALRPAVQANPGLLVASTSPGASHGFEAAPANLPADRFSGAAVKPREHVVTSATTTAVTRTKAD